MIEGIVGGIVGGMLASPNRTVVENKIATPPHMNDHIEYHKWLEKRRNEEIEKDDRFIKYHYEHLFWDCPTCKKKIQVDSTRQPNVEGCCDDTVWLTAACDCKRGWSSYNVSNFPYEFNDDYKKKMDEVYFEHVRNLLEKIRGKIPTIGEFRHNYLEGRLKEKQEMERYYGKI